MLICNIGYKYIIIQLILLFNDYLFGCTRILNIILMKLLAINNPYFELINEIALFSVTIKFTETLQPIYFLI